MYFVKRLMRTRASGGSYEHTQVFRGRIGRQRRAVPIEKQEGVMNARTPYLKLLSASTMALLVILVAGYLMSEPASAQRTPPESDPVLDAVQQVQRSIAGLQVNLDALQQGLDLQLAPMAVKSRWTPAVFVAGAVPFCTVVNISDSPKSIRIELKRGNLGSNEVDTTIEKGPGEVGWTGTGQSSSGPFYCKFTVLNGTRADIRGLMVGLGAVGTEFEIPAE
jgi:hypothetical protein